MNKPWRSWAGMCAFGLAGIVLLAGGGCEQGSDDDVRYLRVEPHSVLMGTNVIWVTLTVVEGARDLSLPLTWTEEHPELGIIRRPTAGYSAVYQRTPRTGINTITVRDQYGAEGYAYIYQVDYWTPEPTNTVASGGATNGPTL